MSSASDVARDGEQSEGEPTESERICSEHFNLF